MTKENLLPIILSHLHHEETTHAKVKFTAETCPWIPPAYAKTGRASPLFPKKTKRSQAALRVRKKAPPLLTSKGEWSVLSIYPIKRREGSIGVAIPRILFPRSTSRNRLRRQIREAIRLLQKEKGMFTMKREHNLLIRVQRGGKSPSFRMIQKEMKTHFNKLGSFL